MICTWRWRASAEFETANAVVAAALKNPNPTMKREKRTNVDPCPLKLDP
jgi:hypothetical protein